MNTLNIQLILSNIMFSNKIPPANKLNASATMLLNIIQRKWFVLKNDEKKIYKKNIEKKMQSI